MTARDLLGESLVIRGSGSKVITASTDLVTLDFGATDYLNVAGLGSERLVLVITATSSGTTDALTFGVLDATDGSGANPNNANVAGSSLVGAAGGYVGVLGVQMRVGKTFLGVTATASGATDTFTIHAVVLGAPGGI